ncbi:MAG: HEPN domain-containing protein [Chloroflexi bacterium]|nr:HEPN domain-containing protein [Chloroflexota bacterium]
MPHDPERVAEVQAWLAKAQSDLRAGGHDLAAAPPFTGDAMFHAQQATEKSLKALLTWHDVPFRKTHDLAEIGRQCVAIRASLEALCRRAERLTVFAWMFRYPGDIDEPPLTEAEEALALAREVYEAIIARLPEEVRP